MIRLIKSIFCKHKFEDKCKVITYNNTTWQDVCPTRARFGNCKGHDEYGRTFAWYCDYYYAQCSKCGKIIKKY